MPRTGMEPIRRASLIKATIAEIGVVGSLEVTVSRIAKRAGMSSALAHHYFGSKEAIFLAAMRHVMTIYGAEVRGALAAAQGPRGRARALVRASFTPANFRREVVAAWLNFYVLSQTQPEARRLLRIYHHRLRANLCHALRPLVGPRAPDLAERLGAMIDGVYLRAALSGQVPDSDAAVALVGAYLEDELDRESTS
jgi:TetR/AcrR family transcriptional repressor of bet genes